MSLSFYLCRTAAPAGPMVTWEDNHALPLGGIDQVKSGIAALFPGIRWMPIDVAGNVHWSGTGTNTPGQPYLDLSISTDVMEENGPADQVYFIVGRKMPPSIMRQLMEGLDLNHVSCPDTGDLIDPYAYSDTSVHYATKAWPPP